MLGASAAAVVRLQQTQSESRFGSEVIRFAYAIVRQEGQYHGTSSPATPSKTATSLCFYTKSKRASELQQLLHRRQLLRSLSLPGTSHSDTWKILIGIRPLCSSPWLMAKNLLRACEEDIFGVLARPASHIYIHLHHPFGWSLSKSFRHSVLQYAVCQYGVIIMDMSVCWVANRG